MTLALSVLSSSVGMCGASAAEALPDTDDSGLQVTVVPLADSNADTDTPADDTKTEKQPVASTGDNTDQPTDGEGDGDNTSSDDKPTIERPEQSDTVETLPGTAEDNKDHIKGEDKDDTEDKGETGEDKDDTEDKGDSGEETPDTGDTEEKGEEGSGSEETPEEKPEETPKEDDTDCSCAYDPDTGHFKITFNIKADAEGDQTIELSKVQEVVSKNGESYLDTDEGKRKLATAQMWGDKTMTYTYNGVKYVYTLATGTVSLYQEPGCTTIFDISLSNGSKHTYVYKDNSLTVATPDVSNTDKTGVTGFDGQELPKEYAGNTKLQLKYSKTGEAGCMEKLVEDALREFDDDHYLNQYLDTDGNPTTKIQGKATLAAGSEVITNKKGSFVKVTSASGKEYYYKLDYANTSLVKEVDGKKVLADTVQNTSILYTEKGTEDSAFGHYDRETTDLIALRSAIKKYMEAYGYASYDDYILDYYKKPNGTKYDSVEELLRNNKDAQASLLHSGTAMPGNSYKDPNGPLGDASSTMDPSTLYNNFYQNILSFKVGDPEKVDAEAGGNVDHNHSHGQWATDGTQETIGDYMAGKLNETPGAWDKANAYFNTLLANGMSEDEATWAAFTMATNIDGLRAGNDYQNTAWNWYASMVLHQADGTLDLTKTDKDTGEIIGDDEGEGQTSFYLWKYETDKETGEKDTMYCTYVEPTYTTNEDGEQVLEKDGFYCWVKYDPSKDKLTYTVTTTNGKLNIDYALLENVVYYLQEAIAPDGYDTDPEIYVICDEESYKELEGTEVTNPATGATSKVTADSWLGSILGGKTLSINFMNTATVVPDPDPEPTPNPDPVPPVDPDIPVDPANPDNPPVKDADPDETPVTPENPQNPAVQDAAPDAAALPQTGTTSWMAGVLASLGSLLLACGWFFTRKQVSPKH
jgi:LPXTG-motif cell wall-anchored protein